MARSKPPKDPLGLGQHLVSELGLGESVDTLGRWMAHHVAELMNEAEFASTLVDRKRAKKDAVEVILKIWEKRAALPGSAYPLAPYKDALSIVAALRPSSNPFRYIILAERKSMVQLAAELVDSLSRLVVGLILLNATIHHRIGKVNPAALHALTPDEQQILVAMTQWTDLLISALPKTRTRDSRRPRHGPLTRRQITQATLTLAEGASHTLDELRKILSEGNRKSPRGPQLSVKSRTTSTA